MSIKNQVLRFLMPLFLLLLVAAPVGLSLGLPGGVFAVTTANITITVTPGVVAISCNASSYAYGTLALSTTSNTSTAYFGITNTSTVITNHSIGVTGATWTGGATAWTHDNTATAGADTCGMKANKAGTWGTGDVIIKSSSLNNIATNQAATTDYTFGLQMVMPTSTTVNDQKTNTVQITVSAA